MSLPGSKVVVDIDELEPWEGPDRVEPALPEGRLGVLGQLPTDDVADPAVEPVARVLCTCKLLGRETVDRAAGK